MTAVVLIVGLGYASGNSLMYSHEEAFVKQFVHKDRQARLLALLTNEKKRRKFIGQLAHFRDFDDRRLTLVPPDQQSVAEILPLLVRAGAAPTCYVFSEDKHLDKREMKLREALDATVNTCMGTIISCVPGRVAYYEGEQPGKRYILRSESPG